jgi:effector-binding domain-containing protein
MIHVLIDIGVQAEIIKDLTENRTPVDLLQLLFEQQELVENELHFLQEVHSVISTFYGLLNEGLRAIESKIYVTEQPEKKIILGGENNFNGDESFYKEFIRFCTAIHEPILNIPYPIGGFFEDIDVFLETPSQPTRFFSLDPHGNDNKPKGLYLVGYTRGYYGQTNDLPQLMAAFARKDGLRFNGPVYNIYVQDELSIKDPNQYLLQVSASVKETRRSRRPGHHL